MKHRARAPHAASRSADIHTLITVASLALTIGGWAGLARSADDQPPTAINPVPVAAGSRRAIPALPTIVPEPASRPGDELRDEAAVAPTTVPEIRMTPPAAAVQPPEPAAVTRSSR